MLRPLREMPLTVEGKTSDSGIRVGAILEQNNGPQHYPALVCMQQLPMCATSGKRPMNSTQDSRAREPS